MKRYLLFQYDGYYPSGGWNDFCGSYDTVEEALTAAVNGYTPDYYQVVDAHKEEVRESGSILKLLAARGSK